MAHVHVACVGARRACASASARSSPISAPPPRGYAHTIMNKAAHLVHRLKTAAGPPPRVAAGAVRRTTRRGDRCSLGAACPNEARCVVRCVCIMRIMRMSALCAPHFCSPVKPSSRDATPRRSVRIAVRCQWLQALLAVLQVASRRNLKWLHALVSSGVKPHCCVLRAARRCCHRQVGCRHTRRLGRMRVALRCQLPSNGLMTATRARLPAAPPAVDQRSTRARRDGARLGGVKTAGVKAGGARREGARF